MPVPHNHLMSDGHIPALPQQPVSVNDWMMLGTQFHAGGESEKALTAFEKALSLAPQDVNAASACATLLTIVQRPKAAYQVLLAVENLLMQDADGAANLAIAAEACGDLLKAQEAYNRALQLNPTHIRAMNNVGLVAAANGQWPLAISLARKCLELDASHPPHHVNLVDYLMGARRDKEALQASEEALQKFPQYVDLKLRHVVLLALNENFKEGDAAIQKLDAAEGQALNTFLNRLFPVTREEHAASPGERSAAPWDAFEIYTSRTLADLQSCRWQQVDAFTKILRSRLADGCSQGSQRDWRRAMFVGEMLGLDEEEISKMQVGSVTALTNDQKKFLPKFGKRRKTAARINDVRIHVGLLLEDLEDSRQVKALIRQLALHDRSHFAMHVYLSTGQADEELAQALRKLTESLVEMSHMPDADAASRIRLDQLDVCIQISSSAIWRRPSLAAVRVAAVQTHHIAPHRKHVRSSFDYSISDIFVHPEKPDPLQSGAVVRMPHSCWLALQEPVASQPGLSRESFGLPAYAFVLCALMAPVTLDAFTFSIWMRILRSLPDAVLWLLDCPRDTAAQLVHEAGAAGVSAARLVFSDNHQAAAFGGLSLANLYLDTLRKNNPQGIEAAIQGGLPVITSTGNSMVSRMGGSILHAAGLPELVTSNAQEYVAEIVRLGRQPDALAALKTRVQAARSNAPILNIEARVREIETAWTVMAERSRAGLPPEAFDVPASNGSTAH